MVVSGLGGGVAVTRHEANTRSGGRAISSAELRRVIIAAALGAIFESYDLTLFGPLAAIVAVTFFSGLDAAGAYVFALLSFAVSYLVRPLGAVIFGRIGDRIGRKYSFLATIVILGISTVLIGLVPGYRTIGLASPLLMMALRVLQGLAFGGEFGSAVTYIAEFAPPQHRGLATAAFAITGACGLVLAILAVLAVEFIVGKTAFEAWGWRVPFLLSAVLMVISLYMRLRLQESPLFVQLKAEGAISRAPLRETFGTPRYLRRSVLAVLGAIAGNSVAVAVGAYPIYFLMLNLRIDPFLLHYTILGYSALLVPFIVAAAWLSDRVGRKPLMLAGFLLTALACVPVFEAITHWADPQLEAALAARPVQVRADPNDCTWQLDPIGVMEPRSSCDLARKTLAKAGVPYVTVLSPRHAPAEITLGASRIAAFNPSALSGSELLGQTRAFQQQLTMALTKAKYPQKADPGRTNVPALVALIALLNLCVALSAGPLAAWLVEMFPTRIRDTALSVPYNVGAWFGGFLPTIVFATFTVTGSFYAGLWYAIFVLAASTVVGAFFLPETRGRTLEEVG